MSIELLLILVLVLILILGTKFNINIGLLALVAAYLLGAFVMDMKTSAISGGFPSDLFLMIFGLVILMSIASLNGTVEYLVGKIIQASGGNIILLPWIVFFSGMLISSLGPPAAPILFIIGLGFAKKYQVNALLMGALAMHGTQAGMYSPIAPYGVYLVNLAEKSGFSVDSWTLYISICVLATILAVILFLVLGGRKLAGQKLDPKVIQETVEKAGSIDTARGVTLLGFGLLLVGSFFRPRDLGFLAIVIAVMVLFFSAKEVKAKAIKSMAWSVLVVIFGVLVYVNVMQEANTFQWLAEQGSRLGAPKVVGLLMGYVAGAVTAVSSTFGTFGFLIPMTSPFIESGIMNGTTLLIALAFSASVTDISPFSPFGAMYLGFSEDYVDREKLMKDMLRYTFILILVMPLVTWLFLVLPNW